LFCVASEIQLLDVLQYVLTIFLYRCDGVYLTVMN